jgi:hypothetical protein
MRCVVRKDGAMNLNRFCKGLNDDIRREVVL